MKQNRHLVLWLISFKIIFDEVISNCKKKVDEINQNTSQELNRFFYPDLYVIIHSMFYLVAFWSGFMVFQNTNVNGLVRLDNNIVENWFGYLKTSFLKMLVMPSQLAGLLHKRLLVKYFEFYFNMKSKEAQGVNQINQMQETFKPTKNKKENYNKERGIYF
jgi:hypothetical protein